MNLLSFIAKFSEKFNAPHYELLGILAIGLVFALILGFITQKIGLSSIVGYLIAGFCISSITPGFKADYEMAFQLAEAGVVLLMFSVGLHFDIKTLLSVKGIAIPGAIVQSIAATTFGTFIGMHLGLTLSSSLILGLGLAVASTVVLIRVLTDNNVIETVPGKVAVGWLVVEDILTVLILVILPSLAGILSVSGASADNAATITILKEVGLAVLRLGILWLLVMEVGGRFVPFVLSGIAKTRSQELFTIAVLVIAFMTAVVAALLFEASLALGAFLGGMVVGRTKLSDQAAADLLPLRDTFAVIFFLSVGMLLDPRFLLQYPVLVMVCITIVLIIKPLTALIVITLLGYSPRTSLVVAAGLAQVGEFSFILAQEAQRLKLVGPEVYNAIVITAIVSITLNPAMFKRIPKFASGLKKNEKVWNFLNYFAQKRERVKHENAQVKVDQDQKMAIVVGYGPTGQSVTEALIANNIKPVIIDMNLDTVISLTQKSVSAVFGDCSKKEVLQAAGIAEASYLIITVPLLNITTAAASLAAILNRDTRVLVRARFLNSLAHLKQIGVKGIAFEEEEVSKGLTALLLEDLEKQKTQPQIDD